MNKQTKTKEAKAKARLLLDNKGLAHWSVKQYPARTPIAETDHATQTIGWSKYFAYQADQKTFLGVIGHEIVHAILGPGHGHNKKFQEFYPLVNDDPKFLGPYTDIYLNKYIFECPKCYSEGSHNKIGKYYCIPCGKRGVSSEIQFRDNVIQLVPW